MALFCVVTVASDILTSKMGFQDSSWEICLLNFATLAASVLRYCADKQTAERENPIAGFHHNNVQSVVYTTYIMLMASNAQKRQTSTIALSKC